MKGICINYMTLNERGEENKQLVMEIFKQLFEQNLIGVKYAVFKMGENIFVHLAQFESEEAGQAFQRLPAFQAFQKNLNSRLISLPILTPMTEIDTFTTFDNLLANGET